MLLSICIPVYNQDVRELVNQLTRQCRELDLEFEILLYDDGSRDEFRELNEGDLHQEEIKYQNLKKNIGRSAIRNKMGSSAKGEYLLFLDGDSLLVSDDLIRGYIQAKPAKVMCGGRIYPADLSTYLPEGAEISDYWLHWNYGRTTESTPAKKRNRSPWSSFQSNNFFIERKVFLKIQFNEELREYGHEDTLFGIMLRQHKIPVKHMNNPVYHIGIEKNEVFLQKSLQALDNLLYLQKKYPYVTKDIKALKYLKRVREMGVRSFLAKRFRKTEASWRKNLTGSKPSLRIFKLYKLGYLCENYKG